MVQKGETKCTHMKARLQKINSGFFVVLFAHVDLCRFIEVISSLAIISMISLFHL